MEYAWLSEYAWLGIIFLFSLLLAIIRFLIYLKNLTDHQDIITVNEDNVIIGEIQRKKYKNLSNYKYRKANISDLSFIHKMAKNEFINTDISPLSLMEEWYKQDPYMFHVVIKERLSPQKGTSSEKIVGYFSLMRITVNALNNLKDGDITGAAISTEDIDSKSKILYIGAIVGLGKELSRDRSATLQYTYSYIKHKVEENKIEIIYARPVTNDGNRLIEKNKFIKDDCKNVIYYKTAKDV